MARENINFLNTTLVGRATGPGRATGRASESSEPGWISHEGAISTRPTESLPLFEPT